MKKNAPLDEQSVDSNQSPFNCPSTREVEDLKNQLVGLQKQLHGMTQMLEEKEQKVRDLEFELETTQQQGSREIEHLNEQIEKMNEQVDRRDQTAEYLESLIEDLESKNEDLEIKNGELKLEIVQQRAPLKIVLDYHRKRNEDLERELERVLMNDESMIKECTSLQNKIDKMRKKHVYEIICQENHNKELEKRNKMLEKNIEDSKKQNVPDSSPLFSSEEENNAPDVLYKARRIERDPLPPSEDTPDSESNPAANETGFSMDMTDTDDDQERILEAIERRNYRPELSLGNTSDNKTNPVMNETSTQSIVAAQPPQTLDIELPDIDEILDAHANTDSPPMALVTEKPDLSNLTQDSPATPKYSRIEIERIVSNTPLAREFVVAIPPPKSATVFTFLTTFACDTPKMIYTGEFLTDRALSGTYIQKEHVLRMKMSILYREYCIHTRNILNYEPVTAKIFADVVLMYLGPDSEWKPFPNSDDGTVLIPTWDALANQLREIVEKCRVEWTAYRKKSLDNMLEVGLNLPAPPKRIDEDPKCLMVANFLVVFARIDNTKAWTPDFGQLVSDRWNKKTRVIYLDLLRIYEEYHHHHINGKKDPSVDTAAFKNLLSGYLQDYITMFTIDQSDKIIKGPENFMCRIAIPEDLEERLAELWPIVKVAPAPVPAPAPSTKKAPPSKSALIDLTTPLPTPIMKKTTSQPPAPKRSARIADQQKYTVDDFLDLLLGPSVGRAWSDEFLEEKRKQLKWNGEIFVNLSTLYREYLFQANKHELEPRSVSTSFKDRCVFLLGEYLTVDATKDPKDPVFAIRHSPDLMKQLKENKNLETPRPKKPVAPHVPKSAVPPVKRAAVDKDDISADTPAKKGKGEGPIQIPVRKEKSEDLPQPPVQENAPRMTEKERAAFLLKKWCEKIKSGNISIPDATPVSFDFSGVDHTNSNRKNFDAVVEKNLESNFPSPLSDSHRNIFRNYVVGQTLETLDLTYTDVGYPRHTVWYCKKFAMLCQKYPKLPHAPGFLMLFVTRMHKELMKMLADKDISSKLK